MSIKLGDRVIAGTSGGAITPSYLLEYADGKLYFKEGEVSDQILTIGRKDVDWPSIDSIQSMLADYTTRTDTQQLFNTISTLESTVLSLQSDVSTLQDEVYGSDNSADIISLGNVSGTRTLENGKVYTCTITGTTTFSLPRVDDTSKFSQILVQIYMSTARTINVGTSHYFGDKAPNLSEAGYYNLIYEYNSTMNAWVCGCLRKV